ncbi:MAG: hypothetical protein D6730_23205 [Bacteroidetes bacterium]|nr:MAG: hypothetical protein D6730_23205 [Bacteroidota bacterium]
MGKCQQKVQRPLKLSVGLAGYSYLGDFSDGRSTLRPIEAGAGFGMLLDGPSRLKIQAHAGFGKFAAQAVNNDKPGRPVVQNTFVETPFFYADLRLRYHLELGKWEPFVSIGAGVLGFSPRDANGKKLKYQSQTRNESEVYNSVVPELPASIGVERHINHFLALGMHYTLHYTPTDYLDNVGQLGARPGQDVLHALSIHVSFTLRQPPAALPEAGQSSALSPLLPDTSALHAMHEGDTMGQAKPAPDSAQAVVVDLGPEAEVQATASPPKAGPAETKTEALIIDPNRQRQVQAAIAADNFTYYRISKGDDLLSLCRRFRLPPATIRQLNYLKDDQLRPGAFLKLPLCEGVPH